MSKRNLIVEDEESIRNFMKERLSPLFIVETASNGKEARDIIRKEHIDLVISDVMMPEMNGYELCTAIKSDINLCHIPIIFLTAKNDIDSKVKGLKVGAEAYIEKPFSPDQLKAQISSLLRTRDEIRRFYAGKFMTEFDTGSQQNRLDEEFILKCRDVIIAHMRNPDLSVGLLARELAMGRTLIFRQLKAVTGLTPNDLMKLIRLNEAKRMIIAGRYRITEIGFLTGFSSSSYFAKCLAKQFGVLPTEFLKKQDPGTQ